MYKNILWIKNFYQILSSVFCSLVCEIYGLLQDVKAKKNTAQKNKRTEFERLTLLYLLKMKSIYFT